ncbi:MAG TPA: cytochrome b/b6 domain-containing protein [Noviherbaspirillum sp.]|uniref:cytochrome b/b6 domain-containing protein n=1 Tax=Noviherbaspirillum sp. TaxID=1926288 RepID=UPI002D63BD57|nr:cytochrome b/b6 domain-containing protein [Noviherbaspirillum sp.]HYD96424.1 cytochrome b/b6 domain-containing protein [Noviherbaspirillum sp.]
MKKVRVWDLPIRLFHWALAALVVASVVTENIGGNAMDWHFRAGYAVLALLGFRILWGLVGPRYARFSSFLYGPSTVMGYLRGEERKRLGHNPLGSLAVFALLGVVLAQAVSGLFSNDDIVNEGPLVKFISKELSDSFTWFHTEVSATAIYVMVGLHLAAIAFYQIGKRQNLVRPMITGDHEVEFDAPAANDSWAMRLLALALLAAWAGAVYYLVTLPAPSV